MGLETKMPPEFSLLNSLCFKLFHPERKKSQVPEASQHEDGQLTSNSAIFKPLPGLKYHSLECINNNKF